MTPDEKQLCANIEDNIAQGKPVGKDIKLALANPALSGVALARISLLKINNPQQKKRVLADVASHANTLPMQYAFLCEQGDIHARAAIALKTDIPTDLLVALSKDRSSSVRANVTKNAMATPETLALLATDKKPMVKMLALLSKGAPDRTLVANYKEMPFGERGMIAQYPQLHDKLLSLVVNDTSEYVKRAFAWGGKHQPDYIIKAMDYAKDKVETAELIQSSPSISDTVLVSVFNKPRQFDYDKDAGRSFLDELGSIDPDKIIKMEKLLDATKSVVGRKRNSTYLSYGGEERYMREVMNGEASDQGPRFSIDKGADGMPMVSRRAPIIGLDADNPDPFDEFDFGYHGMGTTNPESAVEEKLANYRVTRT